jgi:hypothetical protein
MILRLWDKLCINEKIEKIENDNPSQPSTRNAQARKHAGKQLEQ